MNEEIRNNEIRENELESVNGGMDLGILPGFGPTNREPRNKEISTELNNDALEIVAGGEVLPAMLNPFTPFKELPPKQP